MKQNNNNKKTYDVIKLKKGVGRDTATAGPSGIKRVESAREMLRMTKYKKRA